MIENMFDIHCHFLPGVDDGSDSMETTVSLLEADARDGVTDIIVTPHFRRRMFEPPMSLIWKQFDRVQEKANEMGLRLYLGCEYHAHVDMAEALDEHFRPTMAGSWYVLTEFSEDTPERVIRERTLELRSHGYIPIIAHLERYVYFCVKNGRLPEDRFRDDAVLIGDDIFCGVVPIDPTERAWREEAGRFYGRISARAEKVCRMFCGLPLELK